MRLCEAALSLIVVSLFTSSAFGQPSSAGVIRGTVIDAASGTPLRKVSVWLQSTGQTVLTDDQGRFEMIEVTAGPQELCVSVVDFGLAKPVVTVAAARPSMWRSRSAKAPAATRER